MSWHLKNVGTKEVVKAAIDEAVAQKQGMPAPVGDYLKDAVDAVGDKPGYLVSVESAGHRPMQGSGSTETCKVELVKSGPWELPPAMIT